MAVGHSMQLLAAVALAMVAGASAAIGNLVPDQVLIGNGEVDASLMIYIPCIVGMIFAAWLYYLVSKISIAKRDGADQICFDELKMCFETVQTGARAFLWAEYSVCTAFIIVFGVLILIMTSRLPNLEVPGEVIWDWKFGGLTFASFLVGGLTSIASGYIGMMVKRLPPVAPINIQDSSSLRRKQLAGAVPAVVFSGSHESSPRSQLPPSCARFCCAGPDRVL